MEVFFRVITQLRNVKHCRRREITGKHREIRPVVVPWNVTTSRIPVDGWQLVGTKC
jgi:hypothetical protein